MKITIKPRQEKLYSGSEISINTYFKQPEVNSIWLKITPVDNNNCFCVFGDSVGNFGLASSDVQYYQILDIQEVVCQLQR